MALAGRRRDNEIIDVNKETHMNIASDVCVVCGSAARQETVWTADECSRAYSRKFGSSPPASADMIDYRMMKCVNCSLVFSDPPRPGNENFYGWITSQANYYKESRWEWKAAIDLIRSSSATTLMDVGCGSGIFLDRVSAVNKDVRLTGLDTLPASIEQVKSRGHAAICMTIEDYIESADSKKYDVLTSFHCLEHVSKPLDLITSMRKLLAQDGKIILSVPYSPASWEVIEWDCLNLPPHHLTRWNESSLLALADAAGLVGKVYTDAGPTEYSLLKSVYWLYRETIGLGIEASAAQVMGSAMQNPGAFWKCLSYCLGRGRVDGKIAGSTALAVFQLK